VTSIDRDGVAIHYEVHGATGTGTPLLLSHGYAASSAMWAPNLAALSADRPVVTWDIRGHGSSDSPDDPSRYTHDACLDDMVAILDTCGIDRVAIGGHSLGGFLTLAFHLAHPERTAALLLVDTGPGFKQDDARARWNAQAEAYAAAFDARGLDALPGSPEVTGGRHDPAGLARAARGILVQHDDRVIRSLPDIDSPTLVVVGERDRLFLAAADHLSRRIAGASQVRIPDAGHAPNIDQPAIFDAAVTAFLREVDRRF